MRVARTASAQSFKISSNSTNEWKALTFTPGKLCGLVSDSRDQWSCPHYMSVDKCSAIDLH
eukprot:6195876-Pleurochrysis_carterae.AAC.1